MPMVVLSSGHGKHIAGASCEVTGMDEVMEARKVVEEVARWLEQLGV